MAPAQALTIRALASTPAFLQLVLRLESQFVSHKQSATRKANGMFGDYAKLIWGLYRDYKGM